jgi:hypothetical protein
MTKTYHVFGLNILSAIDFSAQEVRGAAPDVTIEYGSVPEALNDPASKGIRFQAGPGEFLLRVDNVARYYVHDGRKIIISPESDANEADILLFLTSSAMGALLHQRNILTLHGSAIRVNGESVVFAGPSGIGKSTLAAGFTKRGYPFMVDDVCAISASCGHPSVIPGFPRLKLWADTLKKIDTETDGLECVRWGRELEKYYLPSSTMLEGAAPLRSVFILETTNSDDFEIIPLKGKEKIGPIIINTYRPQFLEGLGGQTTHFNQCAALAAKVTVKKIVRPSKGFLLDELMDLLEGNF